MLHRLTITILDADFVRLSEVARRERREPKQQASILLVEALQRAVRRSDRRDATTTARDGAR